jgi:hypothetical protein
MSEPLPRGDVPFPLEYARPRPSRAAERLLMAFAAVAIIGLLGTGSVAWALLVRHR